MKNGTNRRKKKFWPGVSPWIIIGALVILVPIFIFMTLLNINKQKEYTTQLLLEKGAALIRSFEAGARTGIGMQWSGFQLQKLLIETAQQPDIDHLILTDGHGTILADSDPSMIGEPYGNDLDLASIAKSKQVQWRQVPNPDGADTFEVFRRFSPGGEPFQGFRADGEISGESSGYIIFVGMDTGPVVTAREQDTRYTIWMAVVFLLIGCSGVISLFLAQGYRLAKASLSRIKAFSDTLVENMPMGLVAVNDQGEIIAFNQTAETITGYIFRDVIGKKAGDILPPPFVALLQNLRTEKKIIEKEIDCPVRGEQVIPLEVIATTLQEENGEFLGCVILIRDITEIRRLKKEIAISQRLASLGNLAAGVAHEIRNPLSSIKGFATFFKERYRDRPEDKKTAEIMIQEVDRLNRVISQLLEFARPLDINKKRASIHTVIQDTLKMIEEQAGKKEIIVHADLSPDVGDVFIDPDKITQVFLNLYLNAVDAMEDKGVLSVILSPQNDGFIRIDVSNTGRGIEPNELSHIFDPYFTTKPTGTGLGLAIVHKIIEAHGGEIRVESVKEKGTTLSIFLPPERKP
jgi:two-component system sensor histidine kinase HydH